MNQIEKVARAIGDHIEEAHISQLKIAAKAAIEAIREPTEAMVWAGSDQCGYSGVDPKIVYKAMIDVALADNDV